MRKLLAVTAIVFALPAAAADLPKRNQIPPVPLPAPIPVRFTLEGQLGVVNVWDVSSNFGNTGSLDLHFDPGLTYGVEAGVTGLFAAPVRLGVSYNGFNAQIDKVVGTGSIAVNGVPLDLNGTFSRAQLRANGFEFDNRVNVFMANAYYDFMGMGALRPFIGVGIGAADLSNAKDLELALSASVGAQYDLTQNLYVGAKLTGFWVSGPEDQPGISYDNIIAGTGSLTLGVRF